MVPDSPSSDGGSELFQGTAAGSSRTLTTTQTSFDIIVAGGGPAGTAAALAAARSGARVALVHDRPVLGGNASSEIRMHIVGADGSGQRGAALATEAREGGLIEEIRLDACVRNPQRSPSMFDLILYDKCRAEPNLTLLLNTSVVAAVVREQRIQHVVAVRQSTEDVFELTARVFIDCTGDGRLGVEAGASFREGREDRSEFGESLAQPESDRRRLGSTIMFQARRHDRPMPFVAPSWARRFTEDDLKLRPHAVAEFDRGLEYGYWWVEWGGCLDTIRDNEQIRDELLRIVLGVWDHVKNGGEHGADNWALEWFGFLPGKRESRRFIGLYTLTEADVMTSPAQPDAIAFGGWPIDLHPPEGVDAKDLPPCVQHKVPQLYDIPLRCCISRDISNLMFAGRNFSATHVAFASTRVMATCAAVGQGAGVAAAWAAKQGVDPAEIPSNRAALHDIQQQLLRDDVYLIGRLDAEVRELAKRVRVAASSFQTEGPPEAVLSGQTRCVHGELGAPLSRANPGTHRWMSDPIAGFPAVITLDWPAPVESQSVQLIFDTGMHRVLTFSLADGYTAMMDWGRPQPETVRDYNIEVALAGEWRPVTEVVDNFQRRRRHALDGEQFDQLRVTVTATNGLDHARICEIRVR